MKFSFRRWIYRQRRKIAGSGRCVETDLKMNFKKHINYITGKIAKHAGILYRIKHGMPLQTRLTY